MTIPPGSTIGILGGGQLGRMLAVAAAQLGYRSHIYAPEASGPAAEVSLRWTQGAYDDDAALAAFAAQVDVVTYEFENIPADPIEKLGALVPVRPGHLALATAQDRRAEKHFVAANGGTTVRWAEVTDRASLNAALAEVGTPAILKTARFGYDGKGQARLRSAEDADRAWEEIGGQPAILEAMASFEHEFSVIGCRAEDGSFVSWDAPANVHRDGILAVSTVPAPEDVQAQVPSAAALVRTLADALDYVGVLTCEFFATPDGPRVHNSGHWTIEGAITSQFENHIRAVCGLPLGSTALAAERVEMLNLIGTEADEWATILADPAAHLHLYGKREARPGRKMGHVTRLLAD
jgi:5-(carboxyamino)imidazole ribonucleotide synthase